MLTFAVENSYGGRCSFSPGILSKALAVLYQWSVGVRLGVGPWGDAAGVLQIRGNWLCSDLVAR